MGKMARQQKYKNAAAKSVKETHDKIFDGAPSPVGNDSSYFPSHNLSSNANTDQWKDKQASGKDVEKDFPNVKLSGNALTINPDPAVLKTVSSPSTRSKNWIVN